MKLLFLAAAAAIAIPAAAQTTPDPAPQDQTAPTTTTTQDPVGGYEPATPPMNGTPQPGATIVFRPSQSPDQAFPPPPAQANYPLCSKKVKDDCRQRGG
ncbi:hypothetical protein ACFO8O_04875 [Hephaestia sp. GCM10023244]|uniref:hypothetical protein n=1 Tax=unclassified Hephaestia TaxID=2631281 RepID=UPI0020770CF3|nr:hypothetical protein [Hephaestia sp. MAHUQ-44]MCM8730301.1 hypothetical protein [Hephaestia sp. MAHUQ-44]